MTARPEPGTSNRDRLLFRYGTGIALAATGATFLSAGYEKAGLGLLFITALICAQPPVRRRYGIRLPFLLELCAVTFLLMALLGNTLDFYAQVPYWNKLTHLIAGVMLGAIGYALVDLLAGTEGRRALPAIFIPLFAMTFSVTGTALWEVWEFAVDATGTGHLLQLGLRDTMWDLIAGTIGALVAGVIGYARTRRRPSG